MKVKFVIPGEPKGKQRPRTERRGEKTVTRTPDMTVFYENLVKTTYAQRYHGMAFGAKDALDLRVTAYYTIPESASKKQKMLMRTHVLRPLKKPDYDNIAKVVSDSLNKIAFHDDAQIVDAQIRKFYSDNPRVVVTIQEAKVYQNGGDDR